MKAAERILSKKSLRITRNRITVLDAFIQYSKALSHSGLRSVLNRQINRVSLYRTLADLVEAGILSRLVDSEGVSQYLYPGISPANEVVMSPYFRCKCCERITQLPQLPVAYMEQVANTGLIHQFSLLLEGICRECALAELSR